MVLLGCLESISGFDVSDQYLYLLLAGFSSLAEWFSAPLCIPAHPICTLKHKDARRQTVDIGVQIQQPSAGSQTP